MEEEMTSGPCELSAMPLSASEMFGLTDHPPWQGEENEKDGSDKHVTCGGSCSSQGSTRTH